MKGDARAAGRGMRLAVLFLIGACNRTEMPATDSTVALAPAPTPPAQLPVLEGWGKARPVDEAPRDPSLAAFRDTLLDIARRRDSAALHARIHPTVKYSFGESQGGAAGLFAYWHKYESMERLWPTIIDVLGHGGSFHAPDFFYAPWTAGPFPGDSLDAFEFLFIRDSSVVVRERPDSSDPGFGTLSYEVVRAAGGRPDSVWRGITLKDGRTGYVEARHARSPVEWRMGLRRYGSRWMIDFFVAGD